MKKIAALLVFISSACGAQQIASTNATGPAGSVIGYNAAGHNWLYVPVDTNGYLLVDCPDCSGATVPTTPNILKGNNAGGISAATGADVAGALSGQTIAPSAATTGNLNNRFTVDGFTSAIYPGVGQATISYSASVDAPLCQAVSSGGNFYIAVASPNHTVTPGSSVTTWFPAPQTGATNSSDCAWAFAEAWKHTNHRNALVVWGQGLYNTLGLVDYVDGNSFDDEFSVGLEGAGANASYLLYIGSLAIPVVSRTTGAANFSPWLMHDLTIDGNGVASATFNGSSMGGSSIYNVSAGHIAPGSDHVMTFGNAGGDAFQVAAHDINIGIFPDTGVPNCSQVTASGTGTTISFTVTNGGTCYQTPTASLVAHVQITGYQGGAAASPCTVMPSAGGVPSFSGGVLTGITNATGATGCAGPYYVQVYESTPVNYGIVFHNSDSHDEDITSYSGDLAAFYIDGGNDSFTHLHPSVVPNGIIDRVPSAFIGTEIDAVYNRAFQFNSGGPGFVASVEGTNGYVGSSGGQRLLPGSSTYYFANTTSPVNFTASGQLADATTGLTGWQEFVTQSGPVINPVDYAKTPTGTSVAGNDKSLGQAMGDYLPNLSTINSTDLGNHSIIAATPAAANGSSNQNSPQLRLGANYGDGTTSQECYWSFQNNLGTGVNPISTLAFGANNCPGTNTIDLGSNPVRLVAGWFANGFVSLDGNGIYHADSSGVSSDHGTIRGGDGGGYITGLSAVSSVTVTFSVPYNFYGTCLSQTTVAGVNPTISSTLGNTSLVTFSFAAPYTGGLAYNCFGSN